MQISGLGRHLRSMLVAVVWAVCWLSGFHAEAQTLSAPTQPSAGADEAGRILFNEGVDAFDQAHYEYALERFRLAFDLSHRTGLLYNIGLTEDRLRHDREALAAFEQFLSQSAADEPRRAEVARRVEVLQAVIVDRERVEARANAASISIAPADAAAAAPVNENARRSVTVGDDVTPPSHRRRRIVLVVVGVALVAAAVAIPISLSNRSDSPNYLTGDTGNVVFTLRGR